MFGDRGRDDPAAGQPETDADGVELGAAIEALRAALVRAADAGADQRIRFRLEPVELVVQVGVTRAGKGSAGIRWQILSAGGERSREHTLTQTLTLRLTPVLFDEQGSPLPETEQLVSDAEDRGRLGSGSGLRPPGEPE